MTTMKMASWNGDEKWEGGAAASGSLASPGPATALSDGSDGSLLRGLSSRIVGPPVEDIEVWSLQSGVELSERLWRGKTLLCRVKSVQVWTTWDGGGHFQSIGFIGFVFSALGMLSLSYPKFGPTYPGTEPCKAPRTLAKTPELETNP